MKENIKVVNNNGFHVGLMCYDWHKTREVKPHNFIYLSEKEVFEIDSNTPYFKDGTLIIQDEEIKIELGYMEKNPNSITEAEIKKLFTLPAAKLKNELSKLTEDFAKSKVYSLASQVDLASSQIVVIEEFVGKKIDINAVKDKEKLNQNKTDSDDSNNECGKNDKEKVIDDLLKGNFLKMKSELAKYIEKADKELIFKLAKNVIGDLSGGKIKFVNEFCGKSLSVE